jgi:hypothetical protein
MGYRLTKVAAAASVAIGFLPGAAEALPCVGYRQTSSTAGNCATCRVDIYDNPEIQKYFVEANNGWKAELTWADPRGSSASGMGQWEDGKQFDISIRENGRNLSMSVQMIDGSLNFEARFACAD